MLRRVRTTPGSPPWTRIQSGRGSGTMIRCDWAKDEPAICYHDEEWGVPVHDDRRWFEFLILEGAQAGLSWETILQKRERYRKVLSGFNPAKVARYEAEKTRELLRDAGIVWNRLKIAATITNAQAFLKVQKEFGSFDKFIWEFVGGAPILNNWRQQEDVPAKSALSVVLSKEL